MNKSLLLSKKEQSQMMPAFDELLLFSLERRYLEIADIERLELATNTQEHEWDWRSHLRMLRVEEVSYEDESRIGLHLLNMQNVLASMKDDSHNVISVIHSTPEKTSLYYGLSRRVDSPTAVSTDEYAKILQQSLHGNFLGVQMHKMTAGEIEQEVLDPIEFYTNIRAFPGIPSLRQKDPNGPYVQGIDRFIEGMRGEEYCLVTIAEPIPLPVIDGVIKNLFDLSSSIHSQVKATVQKMKGSSDTVNVGLFGMQGNNVADTTGTADMTGSSETSGTTTTTGTTTSDTTGGATSTSSSVMGRGGAIQGGVGSVVSGLGGILGGIAGFFLGGPVGAGWGASIGAGIGSGVGSVAAYLSGENLQESTSSTSSWSKTFSNMNSTSVTNSTTRTQAFTRSVANTIGRMQGFGGMGGYARGWNRSQAVTQEVLNKTAEYCEKLCDAYIERLQAGKNLGLWNVGVYLLTDNQYTQLRAQGLLRAAFSGDTTYWEPMRSLQVNREAIARYIMNFNNPKYDLFMYGEQKETIREAVSIGRKLKNYAVRVGRSVPELLKRLARNDDKAAKMLEEIRRSPESYSPDDFRRAWDEIRKAELGHPFGDIMGGVSTPLNTEELSIIMNVPRQEVQGITIREAAPFGVNYVPDNSGDNVRLGRVVHKRMPVDDIPYVIPQSLFQKHAFVCGVTGLGKTNTCMTLLKNLRLPFLVIEPAKTEYRQMLNFMPELKIFTLGSETVSPFRINPFEFSRSSELLTHIDAIKAVFNAAFPMYASMPYILEEAIIEIYRDKGWDLATTTNRYLDDLSSDEFYDYIPTLQDLYGKIEPIVQRKAYAQEQTMNIQAALMARLSSLLTGSKGLMLNTVRSTPLDEILKQPVVLELKNIGDDDEKCFIMGLILSSIYQHLENNGSIGSSLKHVLLIEEAHRLLRRTPEFVSPEIGNSRGKAVETFTNVISEIREYGEGVIIVDQIPSKLTPDVVKNTNIKIIHRTLAKDDREYVGGTMNLTDAQDKELCILETGRAVVHREGMDKAFLVQMDIQKSGLKPVTNAEIYEHMKEFHRGDIQHYGLDKREGLAEAFSREDFRRHSPNLLACMVSSLIAVMARGSSATDEAGRIFAFVLGHDLGITDEIRRDCHVVYNIDMLFSRLQEKYGGNYRECLKAKRLFIDSWFGVDIDAAELRKSVADFTNCADNEPFAGILRWYTRCEEFRHTNEATIVKAALKEPVNFAELDSLMREVVYKLMCGMSLPEDAKKAISVMMFREIFAVSTGYYARDISEGYAEYLKESEHAAIQ